MIWLALAGGFAAFVLWQILVSLDVIEDACARLDDVVDEREQVQELEARALVRPNGNVEPQVHCGECDGWVPQHFALWIEERMRWACRDCLAAAGELDERLAAIRERRGNVIKLDDHRRAS